MKIIKIRLKTLTFLIMCKCSRLPHFPTCIRLYLLHLLNILHIRLRFLLPERFASFHLLPEPSSNTRRQQSILTSCLRGRRRNILIQPAWILCLIETILFLILGFIHINTHLFQVCEFITRTFKALRITIFRSIFAIITSITRIT